MESRSNGCMESIETTLVHFPYVERGCLQTRTVVASYSSICCIYLFYLNFVLSNEAFHLQWIQNVYSMDTYFRLMNIVMLVGI